MLKIHNNPPRREWPALTARCTRQEGEITERVAAILSQVRTGGDKALRDLVACSCIGQVYPSEGNFLLVKTTAPDPLYRELVAAGVIVRNRSRIAGCEGCLRITVGRPEENDRMLETVKNFRP